MKEQELLSQLVGKKKARQLLAKASLAELFGLLPNTVAEESALYAARELFRLALEDTWQAGEPIHGPAMAKELAVAQLAGRQEETFVAFWLDNRHRLTAAEEVAKGTIDRAAVYPRQVVKSALHHNAAAVIFAHNHPSGIAEPSDCDLKFTETLRQALALIDVRVLDHIVVAANRAISLAEQGRL